MKAAVVITATMAAAENMITVTATATVSIC